MIQPLREELAWMEELGVIHRLDINKATDWCHNLVLVHNPSGKLRVCLDPKTINQALRFHVHNSRTFQDIASSLKKVKRFSKINANFGFWTFPMDMMSQLLTTFNSPWSSYCFMKMPFHLNQSQYFFQLYMDLHFEGINSTTNVITDNVMIHRESDGQHDRHLLQVLNKCCEIGLKLNPDKCEFSKDRVQFYSNMVSKHGLSPDPRKVDIIIGKPAPTSKTELLSFLRMCNYLSPYIPKLSNVMSTLCELSKAKQNSHGMNTMAELSERQIST